MAVHAFVDEGGPKARLLVVAVLEPAQLSGARTMLRSLRKPGQRRLHFSNEGDRRRRLILARILESNLRARVYVGRAPDVNAARASCLTQLVIDLAPSAPQRLVIESREGRDHLDNQVLYEAVRKMQLTDRLTYEHLAPYMEPLLWIPDAVAWAYAKGGDWRRRIAPMLDHVVVLDA